MVHCYILVLLLVYDSNLPAAEKARKGLNESTHFRESCRFLLIDSPDSSQKVALTFCWNNNGTMCNRFQLLKGTVTRWEDVNNRYENTVPKERKCFTYNKKRLNIQKQYKNDNKVIKTQNFWII